MAEEPTFRNTNPSGVCATCGMAKISRDNRPFCPNCDSKTGTRSGLVNHTKDPGPHGTGKADVRSLDVRHVPVVVTTGQRPTMNNLFESLDNLLADMKLSSFTDLRDARKVMKFRKKLAMLKIEMSVLLGEE